MARKQDSSKQANVFMLPSIYNEALGLLVDSLDYFQYYGIEDQEGRTRRQRMMYSCEMARITMRLSSVMAWLIARKAVLAGKLSAEEAIKQFRLECRELCMEQNIEAEETLPAFMGYMLDRSLDIYERAARLDDLLAAHITKAMKP